MLCAKCILWKSALLAAVEKHEMLQQGSTCGAGNGWPCSSHNNCFLLQEKKTDLLVETAEPKRIIHTVFPKGNE